MRIQHLNRVMAAAALLGSPVAVVAEETRTPDMGVRASEAIVRAWLAAAAGEGDRLAMPLATTLGQTAEQGGRASQPAAPSIGMVGLGGLGGLTDFEFGPSFRIWANDRIGFQAHLTFSGDDFGPDDVDFVRFEPTVIVAIGDFGSGAVNVRPYAGGGLRVVRSDIGRFNDSDIKPAVVGGVEFGFRTLPRFKVSTELSVSPDIDVDDFDPPRGGPKLTGARLAALAHYFF